MSMLHKTRTSVISRCMYISSVFERVATESYRDDSGAMLNGHFAFGICTSHSRCRSVPWPLVKAIVMDQRQVCAVLPHVRRALNPSSRNLLMCGPRNRSLCRSASTFILLHSPSMSKNWNHEAIASPRRREHHDVVNSIAGRLCADPAPLYDLSIDSGFASSPGG